MRDDRELSIGNRLTDLPVMLTDGESHVVEFYSRANDDETYSLIMLSGNTGEPPRKQLLQGPFQNRAHIMGAVKSIIQQFFDRQYELNEDGHLQWEMHAQRINNKQQAVRRENAGDFSFKVEDVFFDDKG